MSTVDVLEGHAQWWIEPTHVLDGLRSLPDESVNCVVTSPPYWGLRAYGTEPQVWGGSLDCRHDWVGDRCRLMNPEFNYSNNLYCSAWLGELGSEPTIPMFVSHIVQVFAEVRRVLRKDGVCFLNIGDSYAGSGRGPGNTFGGKSEQQTRRQGFVGPGGWQDSRGFPGNGHHRDHGYAPAPEGLKAKDACLIPFRLAIALQEDGWYVRQPIIWSKPNPMPESVHDRCTTSHEYIFHLTKSARYSWDAEAIKEPVTGNAHGRGDGVNPKAEGEGRPPFDQDDVDRAFSYRRRSTPEQRQESIKRPAGWQEGPGAHDTLPAGRYPRSKQNPSFSAAVAGMVDMRNARSVWEIPTYPYPEAHFATFPPELARRCILAGCPEGGVVLDPFSGSGTVVMVALRHNRRGIGLELNADYVEMSRRRVVEDAPLLNAEIAR